MTPADLAFDRDHLWHPYSSATHPAPAYPVESARGTRLRLRVDGRPREVVDAMSSWWCALHGYAAPELDAPAVHRARGPSPVLPRSSADRAVPRGRGAAGLHGSRTSFWGLGGHGVSPHSS